MLKHKDILIGTLAGKGKDTAVYIKEILPYGFESFQINFWQTLGGVDLKKLAEEVNSVLEGSGAVISSLAIFGNPLKGDAMAEETIKGWDACIENAKLFNQGFETVEYLAASFLDMYWHTLTDSSQQDVISFEKYVFKKIGLIPEIESRYQSTNFLHIFSGDGYSSGYYGYIWAAVLDNDAFSAFEETSLFDKSTAKKFRTLLEKSGTIEPMELYKQFRGREPKVDALLKNRGLN